MKKVLIVALLATISFIGACSSSHQFDFEDSNLSSIPNVGQMKALYSTHIGRDMKYKMNLLEYSREGYRGCDYGEAVSKCAKRQRVKMERRSYVMTGLGPYIYPEIHVHTIFNKELAERMAVGESFAIPPEKNSEREFNVGRVPVEIVELMYKKMTVDGDDVILLQGMSVKCIHSARHGSGYAEWCVSLKQNPVALQEILER